MVSNTLFHMRRVRPGTGNTTSIGRSHWATNRVMTHCRRLVVFLLLLTILSPLFLSERPTHSSRQRRSPPLSNELQIRVSSHTQHLLLTPTFFLHLLWILGLVLLSVIALFEVTLKLVYVGCTLGVACIMPESLPAIHSRYESLSIRVYNMSCTVILSMSDVSRAQFLWLNQQLW